MSSIKRQKISKDVPKGILKSKKKGEPANIISPEHMDHSDATNVDKKVVKKARKAKKELLSEEAEDLDDDLASLKDPEAENEDIKADIEAEAEAEVTKSFKDLVSYL